MECVYDSIGNPTRYFNSTSSGNIYTFTWANGRQLVSGDRSGTGFAYTYNADGLRTKKVVDGVTTEYYWAGSQLAMMVVAPGTSSEKVLKFYYDVAGSPFCFDLDGEIYFYITNLQGDVMQIVSESGSVYGWYEYDAWGKLLTMNGNSSSIAEALSLNPLRYRGYIYDSETEFYYLQSRYYDPAVGRFINADVLVSTGQGITGFNMFAYCGNNPISRVDSMGEAWEDITSQDSESRYDPSDRLFGYESRTSTGWEGTDFCLQTPIISVGVVSSVTEKSGKHGFCYAFVGQENDIMNLLDDATYFAGVGLDIWIAALEIQVETVGVGLLCSIGPLNISASVNLTGATTIAITGSRDFDTDTENEAGIIVSLNTGAIILTAWGIYELVAIGSTSTLEAVWQKCTA